MARQNSLEKKETLKKLEDFVVRNGSFSIIDFLVEQNLGACQNCDNKTRKCSEFKLDNDWNAVYVALDALDEFVDKHWLNIIRKSGKRAKELVVHPGLEGGVSHNTSAYMARAVTERVKEMVSCKLERTKLFDKRNDSELVPDRGEKRFWHKMDGAIRIVTLTEKLMNIFLLLIVQVYPVIAELHEKVS